jgi:hypothetical protein
MLTIRVALGMRGHPANMCNVASGTAIVVLALAVRPVLDSPWEQGFSGRSQRKVSRMHQSSSPCVSSCPSVNNSRSETWMLWSFSKLWWNIPVLDTVGQQWCTLRTTRVWWAQVEHNPLYIHGGKIQFEQKLQREIKYIMFRVLLSPQIIGPVFEIIETDFFAASSRSSGTKVWRQRDGELARIVTPSLHFLTCSTLRHVQSDSGHPACCILLWSCVI